MAVMVRKQVYLERHQNRAVKRLAREKKQTEAQVIREAIDRLVQQSADEKERLRIWEEQKTFIRDWIAQGPVPPTDRKWNREDAHDRPRAGRQ